MVAPGHKVYFQEIVVICCSYKPVAKPGLFCPFFICLWNIRFILIRISPDEIHKFCFLHRRSVFNNSPIGLFYSMLLEHPVQSLQRFWSTGKNYSPGNRPVKPVRDTQVNIPWFIVFLFDVFLYLLVQWYITGSVSLHQIRRGFINYDYMIVFVNDFHLTSYVLRLTSYILRLISIVLFR